VNIAAEQQEVCRLGEAMLNIPTFIYSGEAETCWPPETRELGICMAINMDARSGSLHLHAKSLVHRMSRNKDHSN